MGYDFDYDEIAASPLIDFNLVFHFKADSNGYNFTCDEDDTILDTYQKLYAPVWVRQIVNEMNIRMHEALLIPDGQGGFIEEDCRVRFHLLNDDECSSSYFYSNEESFENIPNAINIRFSNNSNFGGGRMSGSAHTGANYLNIYNALNLIINIENETANYWDFARLILHEWAHTRGLDHSFYCYNPCNGIDLDADSECCGNCGESPYYTSGCWNCSENNLIMAYGIQTHFTKCEFSELWNYMINHPHSYQDFCNDESLMSEVIYDGNSEIVWENKKFFNSDIIIESGTSMIIKCDVEMGSNKRIIVKRGAKLTVDGATITGHCGNQWRGIIVEGNSDIPQPNYYEMPLPNQAGIVITKNNATIKNAKVGIWTNYVGDWSDKYWGGVVHCENTNFIDCRKGVAFMKYNFENKGYLNSCIFSGGKEGVTIWACSGIVFNHCSFDVQQNGIGTIDADFLVQFGNTFSNCRYGIEASASSAYMPSMEVLDNNSFYNNYFGIDASGVNSRIESNYFENNSRALILDGDNKNFAGNNNFGLNQYNIIYDATGYNFNKIICNGMYSQYGGILTKYDNQKTTFLSNQFIGTTPSGFDYMGWHSDIIDEVGNESYFLAMNVFSGVERDIDSKLKSGNDYFVYYVPEGAQEEFIPNYPGNYSVKKSFVNEGYDCSIPQEPITVTDNEIATLITDFCHWLELYRQNHRNFYYRKMFQEIERELHYKYYWWQKQKYETKNWEEIENVLSQLCGDRWKIRLYGFYMKTEQYNKAQKILQELDTPSKVAPKIIPEDLSYESRTSFVNVQKINMSYQISNGAYKPTESELNILRNEANKDIPERAYARGLLLLITNEKFERDIPKSFQDRLKLRAKEKNKDNNWLIYPNPAEDILYVEHKKQFYGKIFIYDLLGNILLKKEITAKNSGVIDINVLSLNEGIYLLVIKDLKNNLINSKKIVISSFK